MNVQRQTKVKIVAMATESFRRLGSLASLDTGNCINIIIIIISIKRDVI